MAKKNIYDKLSEYPLPIGEGGCGLDNLDDIIREIVDRVYHDMVAPEFGELTAEEIAVSGDAKKLYKARNVDAALAEIAGVGRTEAHTVKSAYDLAASAYHMEAGGIPREDLAADVQSALDLAESAYQRITGTAAPASGTWKVGDIVWNEAPTPGGYIGWVCVVAGTPGTWLPFGQIAEEESS